jgi:epoxide hydrolase
LMTRLGYSRFGVQGGDIGAAASPEVGRTAPERVIGVHINGAATFVMPDAVGEGTRSELTDLENDRLARIGQFMQQEYGYIAIQSTRPQTLAYGLVDSPVGQLAWLIDKFREWTYPRNDPPENVIGKDRLLTNAMLYWLTGTAGTSAYVGYHSDAPSWGAAKAPSGVPTASLQTAHDVGIRRFDEAENSIIRWTDVNTGGHFAALEIPEVLVNEIRVFFGALRG